MEYAVGSLVTGLVVGALGRLAVPGPDPMPIWLTIAFGVAGSVLGGGIAAAATRDVAITLLASVVTATVIVIGYRRVVQKRGMTGAAAHTLPTRGIGVARVRRRAGIADDPEERLRRLTSLRDSGLITDEEFEQKRRELLGQL